MWAEYIHHLVLHVPIVGSLALCGVAWMYVRNPADNLLTLIKWGGRAVAFCTVTAMVSGILAAPGWLGGDGPLELSHHRNMGLTIAVVAVGALIAFELGRRQQNDHLLRLGSVLWFAVFFGAVGAGHWGGSVVHSDRVPWDGSEPAIETIETTTEEP